MCLIPGGDLFAAIRAGRAYLVSTATGPNMPSLAWILLTLDGVVVATPRGWPTRG